MPARRRSCRPATNNTVSIEQKAAAGYVQGYGTAMNEANVIQDGEGNKADLTQEGTSNEIDLLQTGVNNNAAISQFGTQREADRHADRQRARHRHHAVRLGHSGAHHRDAALVKRIASSE